MRERRLQTYLLLVLLVAATIPAIVVGAFEAVQVRRTYQQARTVQRQRATALSREISGYVDAHARAVRTLARQLESSGDVTNLDLQHVLDTMRAEYPGIVGTFIGDAEGNALVFSPPTDLSGNPIAGRNYRQATYFEPLMRTKAMVYSDVIPGVVINMNPLVTMVAPLLDAEGNVRYYISGGLDLSRLSEWLSAYRTHPNEVIVLVDNKNTLIAQSGPVDHAPFANLSGDLHVQKLRGLLPWWEDDRELGGYATTNQPPNWGVAIITPRSAFYAPLRSTIVTTATTVLLALVLGWVMAWVFARTMNLPIAALMRAAAAVRRGDMSARAHSPRSLLPREMAELHDSFNAMVVTLQEHRTALLEWNATLEDRVAERTQQVTRRNEELAVLNATAASVTGVHDLPDRLQEMARGIVQLIGADVGIVVLRRPGGSINLEAIHAPAIDWRPPTATELSRGMAAAIIADGQARIIPDVWQERQWFGQWVDRYPHASFCGVPMRAAGDVVGILVGISIRTNAFDDHAVELLTALAGQVGPAVAGAWLFAELQEQWSTLLAITNSMHEGLLLADPDHRVQFATPAAATLLNLASLPAPGTPLAQFFRNWSGGNPGAVLSPARSEGDGTTVSMVDLELPGPPRRTVAATAFPVLGEGLKHVGFGILLRDVTRERQLERSKDELLANVSHELRTPLTTIVGNTATLLNLRGELEPDEQIEFLQGIAEEGQRLRGLIESVLDMSRISGGTLTLDPHPCAWIPLVERARRRGQVRWPGHRFALASSPADLPLVAVDADRIDQVLDNLINNAAQYSEVGTTITMTADFRGGFVLTSVRDEGVGIAPEEVEQIFSRFYRGGSSHVRRVRGTGLGLAICQGIVEAHGGRIWVEATASVGRGSTFTFSLPVATSANEGSNAR